MSTVHGPIREDVTQQATPKPVVVRIPSAQPVRKLAKRTEHPKS